MALWKPFRGNRADLDAVEKHDGYVYFCTDDGTLFFDYADLNGDLQRKQVNASNSEVSQDYIRSLLPKTTTISLPAANWTGSSNPWSQVVLINGVGTNSKIDLQPTPQQIISLQNADIALMTENDSGVITVYALGGKPTTDYTMQVLITEVDYV